MHGTNGIEENKRGKLLDPLRFEPTGMGKPQMKDDLQIKFPSFPNIV